MWNDENDSNGVLKNWFTDTIYSALRLQQTETMKDEYGVCLRDLQEIKTSWTSDTCRSMGGWRGYRDRSNNRTWSCDSSWSVSDFSLSSNFCLMTSMSTHSTSWNHMNAMSSCVCVCVCETEEVMRDIFSAVLTCFTAPACCMFSTVFAL